MDTPLSVVFRFKAHARAAEKPAIRRHDRRGPVPGRVGEDKGGEIADLRPCIHG
jgi:hypothetical protein